MRLWSAAALASLSVHLWLGRAAPTSACSVPGPAPVSALPSTGGMGLTPLVGIFVAAPQIPNRAVLRAGDAVLSFQIEDLGPGLVGANPIDWRRTHHWWLRTGVLAGEKEHVLTLDNQELTRFTTAASYTKPPGAPPALKKLSLWRVAYDPDEIGGGSCVFAEHHGFISWELEPAVAPGFEPDQIVYQVRLAPRTGGAAQTFAFSGASGFRGTPPGDDKHPGAWWHPELEAGREYCATVTAFYAGEAGFALTSAPVCTKPLEVDATAGGGGCSFGRSSSLGGIVFGMLALLRLRRRR